MTTLTSTAHVTTARPARYARQLVAHLGHRVAFVEEEAARTWTTTIGTATGTVTVADDEIVLGAAAPDLTELDRVEHVLGSHLERFGARQELAVSWVRG